MRAVHKSFHFVLVVLCVCARTPPYYPPWCKSTTGELECARARTGHTGRSGVNESNTTHERRDRILSELANVIMCRGALLKLIGI